jgi:hypothetical protein
VELRESAVDRHPGENGIQFLEEQDGPACAGKTESGLD